MNRRNVLLVAALLFATVGCVPVLGQPPAVVVPGACPFECCQYGEWTTLDRIPVFVTERDTTEIAFHLTADDTFTAITGNVHVHPVGLVVVTKPTAPSPYDRPDLQLTVGDTVLVLHPLGEGFYRIRLRDVNVDAQGFWASPGEDRSWYGSKEISGELHREPSHEWWVEVVTPDARRGWIRVGDTRFLGYDACG